MVYLGVRVTEWLVNLVRVSGSETYLIFIYTKKVIALFDFSLIRTRATCRLSLDSQLLGIDMGRNKVNKWAWRKRFRFSTNFVFHSAVSAIYDGRKRLRKRFALERALCVSVKQAAVMGNACSECY